MKKTIWILGILAMALIAKEVPDSNKTTATLKSDANATAPQEIETKALYNLLHEFPDDLYILDIREPDQVAHGEIFYENQVAITRGYLEFKIEKVIPDKNTQIIVYCCSGQRGILAVKTLKEMGYTNVKSLKGGMRKWVEDGYPLDTVFGEMVVK